MLLVLPPSAIACIDVINVYERFYKKIIKRFWRFYSFNAFLFSTSKIHSNYFSWLQQYWQRINY